jgi:hypothetical protein
LSPLRAVGQATRPQRPHSGELRGARLGGKWADQDLTARRFIVDRNVCPRGSLALESSTMIIPAFARPVRPRGVISSSVLTLYSPVFQTVLATACPEVPRRTGTKANLIPWHISCMIVPMAGANSPIALCPVTWSNAVLHCNDREGIYLSSLTATLGSFLVLADHFAKSDEMEREPVGSRIHPCI